MALGALRHSRLSLRLGIVSTFVALGAVLPVAAQTTSTSASPTYVVQRWTSADGLANSTVRAVVQTRDGYLWIAAGNAGLVRFDGVRFTTFQADSTPPFPPLSVSSLVEDASGTLWIGTAAGVWRYTQGAFVQEPIAGPTGATVINTLAIDRQGQLWAGTAGGLARRGAAGWEPVITDVLVRAIVDAGDSGLWIGTEQGLLQYRDGVARELRFDRSERHAVVKALALDADGRLWVGTADGFASVTGGLLQPAPAPLAGIPVEMLASDGRGTLWIGQGAKVFTRRAGRDTEVRFADASLDGKVATVYTDRDGHAWLGITGGSGGLYRLRSPLFTTRLFEGALTCNNAGAVTQAHDGTIWVSALCSYGPGIAALRAGTLRSYAGPLDTSAMLAEPDGTLWVGTFDSRLYRVEGERFVPVPTPFNETQQHGINVIHRHRDGALWLGTPIGLFRWLDGRWTAFHAADGLADDAVRTLTTDADGVLWIGTSSGASRYHDGRFTNYGLAEGVAQAPVRAIYVDRDRHVWLGSYGAGLMRSSGDRFVTLGTAGGVLDTSVHRIFEDAYGYLWLSGDRGIRRVQRTALNDLVEGRTSFVSAMRYDEIDGMLTAEANGMTQPAGWAMRDGTLVFPTQRGIVTVDPSVAARNMPTPAVPQIEALTIGNRAFALDDSAVAAPGSNEIVVQYTAPTFTRPDLVRFRYRLDGFDADWVDAGSRRVAHYAALPPGRYRLRVAAASPGGEWSADHAATVAFALQPAWHQRSVVRVAMVALLVALAGALMHVRVARLRQRARRLDTLVAERTAELAKQRDEVALAHAELIGVAEELELAHQQTLAVMSQLDIGVLAIDAQGTTQYVSASARRLLGDEAVAGVPWTACLPLSDADRAQTQTRIDTPDALGTRFPVQVSLDGRRYWMEIDVRRQTQAPSDRIIYLYDAVEMTEPPAGAGSEAPHGLIGRSTVMQVLFKDIRDVAQVDATVLIEGETGVGKELVARAIHRASRRSAKPFIAVNAAGISESLLASQLFGHRRGAFTGAVSDQVGLFEAANGGTIFLDEIGDIPPTMQVSLLRVLQEREITRIGESLPRTLDVRVLAATHRALVDEVAAGRFRQDLYYRIRSTPVRVPPLRERVDDIPLLVDAFLAQGARRASKPVPELGRDVLAALMKAPWPGNVRELRSAVEHAVLRSDGPVLRLDDLPPELSAALQSAVEPTDLDEKDRILAALRHAGGNRSEAAKRLGVARSTFYRKLAQYEISEAKP